MLDSLADFDCLGVLSLGRFGEPFAIFRIKPNDVFALGRNGGIPSDLFQYTLAVPGIQVDEVNVLEAGDFPRECFAIWDVGVCDRNIRR